jgi:hypothetical protein
VSSSHGSFVKVDGVLIGRLLNVKPSVSASSPVETTNIGSPVVGAGGDSRVVRQYNVSTMEPASVTCVTLGLPAVAVEQGKRVQLAVDVAGFSLQGEAVLQNIEPDASVGEFVRCSITFKFTGY